MALTGCVKTFLAMALGALLPSTLMATEKWPLTALAIESIPYLEQPAWDADRFLGFGFGYLWSVASPNLIRLDPASKQVIRIELEEVMTPGFIGIGEGAVWVTDIASEVIFKVDPASATVVDKISASGLHRDSMIGLGARSLWVVTGNGANVLSRFDAQTGERIARIDLPTICNPGVIFAFGSAWVVGAGKQSLYRIDPGTNAIVGTSPLHKEPFTAAADDTSIWVNNRGEGIIDRIDGDTGAVIASIPIGIIGPEDIATGGRYVWMSVSSSLVQIDPGANRVRQVYDGPVLSPVSYGAGSIWLNDGGAILRVSPPE